MYKQTLLILGGILLVCAGITVYVVWSHQESPAKTEQELLILPVTYTDKDTGKWIDIRFYEKSLVLNGIGFSWLEFKKLESETEAKYENKEENLLLKVDGDVVTLIRGRRTLFVGTSTERSVTEPVDVAPDITASSTVEIVEPTTASSTATTSSEG